MKTSINAVAKKTLQSLSGSIHANNVAVGWWEPPQDCIYQKLQLVSTEIAEATEGARKDIMDTHITFLKMEEVEYADAMIRLLDLGGKLELTVMRHVGHSIWCDSDNSVGKQHLGINVSIIDMALCYRRFVEFGSTIHADTFMDIARKRLSLEYSRCISAIMYVAKSRGFELYEAIELKLDYNAHRPDHKRHNREAPGGKTF